MLRTASRIATLTLALSAVPLLQGCFPVVAAGAGAAAMVAIDRRQPEVVLGDQRIETVASTRLGERFKDQAHINVTSFNYVVLITGEAPTEQLKGDIEQLICFMQSTNGVCNLVDQGCV